MEGELSLSPATSLTSAERAVANGQGSVAPVSEGTVIVPPRTPARVTSNIGKRRGKAPSFARTTPSSGHSAKMARIYEAAKVSLGSPTRSAVQRTFTSNPLRIPRTEQLPPLFPPVYTPKPAELGPQTRMLDNLPHQSGSAGGQSPSGSPYLPSFASGTSDASPLGMLGQNSVAREPISSGFLSPLESPQENAALVDKEIYERMAEICDQTPSRSSGSDNGSGASSGGIDEAEQYLVLHGLPLPGPMTEEELFTPRSSKGGKARKLDDWLDNIFMDSNDEHETEHGARGAHSKSEKSNTKLPHGAAAANAGSMMRQKTCQSSKPPGSQQHKKIRPRSDSNKENQRPTEWGLTTHVGQPPHTSPRPVRLGVAYPVLGTLTQPSPGTERKPAIFSNISATRFQPLKRPIRSPASVREGTPTSTSTPPQRPLATHDGNHRKVDDVPLSPDVDVYRKANRPKRNRCFSYFDDDMFESPGVSTTTPPIVAT